MANKTFFEKREISCNERINCIVKTLSYFVEDFFVGIELRTSPLTRLNYAYDLRVFFDFLVKKVFNTPFAEAVNNVIERSSNAPYFYLFKNCHFFILA